MKKRIFKVGDVVKVVDNSWAKNVAGSKYGPLLVDIPGWPYSCDNEERGTTLRVIMTGIKHMIKPDSYLPESMLELPRYSEPQNYIRVFSTNTGNVYDVLEDCVKFIWE